MPPARCRRQGERPKASGVVLDGQVVDNDARRRLCPVSQNRVVERHPWLRFEAQRQVPWASQFKTVATAVAAIAVKVASALLGDFAVAATAGNIGDVGGRRGRTAV